MPLRKFTATVWLLVVKFELKPKLSFDLFNDNVPRIVIVVESLALALADSPPDTLTWLTCGEEAFPATLTVTAMGG